MREPLASVIQREEMFRQEDVLIVGGKPMISFEMGSNQARIYEKHINEVFDKWFQERARPLVDAFKSLLAECECSCVDPEEIGVCCYCRSKEILEAHNAK
jgi:hypothetical protein